MMNKDLGRRGEDLASSYLSEKGYKVLERNYTNYCGEIDIIALSPEGYLVFIEVKTRSSRRYGNAFEAVDNKKQTKIIMTSLIYIQDNDFSDTQLRYDIVEVYHEEQNKINHIKNAFGG